MANSTSISICDNCGSSFCMECSTAAQWENFCSRDCEKEWKDNTEEVMDDTRQDMSWPLENNSENSEPISKR